MGHEGSSGGHGGGVISTPGTELRPAAADPVQQRENCSAGVGELSARGHRPAA